MVSMHSPTPDTSLTKAVQLTANLAQGAGTYDAGTVSGGDVMVEVISPYVSVAGVGLVSVAIQTNDTIPTVILAAGVGILAALLLGTTFAPYQTPFILPSGKKIQYTIVGTGSAGTMKLGVRYRPLTSGAVLA